MMHRDVGRTRDKQWLTGEDSTENGTANSISWKDLVVIMSGERNMINPLQKYSTNLPTKSLLA